MAERKNIPSQEILAVTYRLWTRQGYHGLGLRPLADELHFSIASLLHRFKSKEELFCAVAEMCWEAWNTAIAQILTADQPWNTRWEALQEQLHTLEPGGVLPLAIFAAELPGLPPAVQGKARTLHESVLGWLVRGLTEAKKRGDWHGDAAAHASDTLDRALGECLRRRF
jgi:AcrR family transcriptional regulator